MSKINKIKVADTTYDIEDLSVPNWAKAENKPTYQYSEIQNTPNLSKYPFFTNSLVYVIS